jgi:hypothetical protein
MWIFGIKEDTAVPLHAWNGPDCSRKLRFPDFMTTAHDGGRVVSLMHRPPLPPGRAPGTHFCQRLIRPQSHSAIGRIMSVKNSYDPIWDRFDLTRSTLTTVLPRSPDFWDTMEEIKEQCFMELRSAVLEIFGILLEK